MTDQDIEKVIREYVTKTVHMSLSTVHDNRPWVCEVHFVYDEDLNLYFVSNTHTRHCQEIAANPNVAGSIVRQHALTEAPNGIYFEGAAKMIEAANEDIDRYASMLERDADKLAQWLKEDKRMYKITVNNWATFGNFDGNGHKKYEMTWSQS